MIEFRVNYEAGHHYIEKWARTEYWCPNCGKQSVWSATGGGDYYVGDEHICTECSAAFYLPTGCTPANERDWQHKQRIDALREPSKSAGSLP